MKKIFNWITGSFFRTLGRIICYLSIGFIIAILASKMGFNLFIIPVNALTTVTPSDYGHKVEYVEYITQLQRTETSNWIKGDFKDFCVGKCYLTKDWYYVKLNQSLNPGITYTWNFNTWITNRDDQNYYNKSNFYMIASNTGKYEGSSSANITNLTCRAGIEEGSTSKVSWSCSFTPTTQINYLYLRITLFNDTDKLFTSYGCNKGTLLNDNAQIDAINNQTGVIKDQTDKIDDTIKDSDITGATEDANGFFNDFSDTDFGLSSIVTAPLRAINAMLNNTCVAPSATYKGQTFSLPCGNILWDRPGGDTFKSFLNVMYGGFLVYFVIRKFFLDVENLKNPNNDKVEVDKL